MKIKKIEIVKDKAGYVGPWYSGTNKKSTDKIWRLVVDKKGNIYKQEIKGGKTK